MKPTANKIFCCNCTSGSIFDPELPLYIYIYTSFKKSMKSWFVTRLVPQIGNKSLYTPTRQLWKSNIENKILYNIYIYTHTKIYLMDPIYIIYAIPEDLNFHWIVNTYICHFIRIYFITAKNTSQKTKNEKGTPANFILSLKYKYKCWTVCLFWYCKCKM